jgi:hypothetical protein
MREGVIASFGVTSIIVRVGIEEGGAVEMKVSAGGIAVGMGVEAELGVAGCPNRGSSAQRGIKVFGS